MLLDLYVFCIICTIYAVYIICIIHTVYAIYIIYIFYIVFIVYIIYITNINNINPVIGTIINTMGKIRVNLEFLLLVFEILSSLLSFILLPPVHVVSASDYSYNNDNC